MYCPKCKLKMKTKVIDSRLQSNQVVRRRRLCCHCGYRFTTWESLLSPDEVKTNIEVRARTAQMKIDTIKEQAMIILNELK